MTDHAGLIERLDREAGYWAKVVHTVSGPALAQTLREAASAIASLVKERDEAVALSERITLEAQAHAQEARTANSTIYEIYQAISGATGEPGNWHGAEPVRAYVKAAEARCARLEEALRPFEAAFSRMETEMFLSPQSLVVPDDMPIGLLFDETGAAVVTVLASDFRRARQALEEQG